jgi:hypothetical protein
MSCRPIVSAGVEGHHALRGGTELLALAPVLERRLAAGEDPHPDHLVPHALMQGAPRPTRTGAASRRRSRPISSAANTLALRRAALRIAVGRATEGRPDLRGGLGLSQRTRGGYGPIRDARGPHTALQRAEIGRLDEVRAEERGGGTAGAEPAAQHVGVVAAASARATFCSISRTVTPSSRIRWTAAKTSSTSRGARPNDGSSSTKRRGRLNERARHRHHLLPAPAHASGELPPALGQAGKQGERPLHPRGTPGAGEQPAAELQVLEHGHPRN